MTRDKGRALLIEAAATAWRERNALGSIRSHPAWHDLDDSGRAEAFELGRALRAIEAAADPEGLSAAGRAVLDRIRRADGRG